VINARSNSIKSYRTKLKEWDFEKQKRLFQEEFLIAKIKELWLQNFSSISMLYALESYGYHLNIVQLRDLRLHLSVDILFQNTSTMTKEEIEQIADTAIQSALISRQSLQWGSGAYTIAHVRLQDIFVSKYIFPFFIFSIIFLL